MENNDEREIEAKDYASSGKIMLIAIVVLFVVIIIMLCIHVYVRWGIAAARRRQQVIRRSPRRRSPQFVFYVEPAARIALTTRGLHPSVMATLPVFTFAEGRSEATECSVCLSEFSEGETGRVLPKCKHSFHTECIDMWFQSHATCPLCRAPVEARGEESVVVSVVCEGQEEEEVVGESSSSSSSSSRTVSREKSSQCDSVS
ncbi:hypothetical protein Fmac_013456 [Flemingia macrophylla]|uniref:RING-type E3 ubiquitin transferase n=1 Tax=Flemingia macrophylla TaxID=520843 RepID=A0ABD1MT66_9FABA